MSISPYNYTPCNIVHGHALCKFVQLLQTAVLSCPTVQCAPSYAGKAKALCTLHCGMH